jgi:hypothetical protein
MLKLITLRERAIFVFEFLFWLILVEFVGLKRVQIQLGN